MEGVEHPVSRETVQAPGRRPYRRQAEGICHICHAAPARPGQRNCGRCHADAQKAARRRERLRKIAELECTITRAERRLRRLLDIEARHAAPTGKGMP